ncbi:MAG: aminoglycoside phosphotransferase family protein [Streptomycetaceae bacterium]|nr:aminoglycoside phosphotransferase family protein [Streptomycetaceae bacterium]
MSAALPSELQRWVTAQLGGLAEVTDVSWPRTTSRVWRLTRSGGVTAYVKIAPGDRHYEREVYAYRHAAVALGPGRAPRLLASEPQLHAVMTSALPGAPVKGLALSAVEERAAHRAAGGVLRRLHELAPRSAEARTQADAAVRRTVARSKVYLARATHLVTYSQRDLVYRSWQLLLALAPQLPVAFRHGDFRPRNWQWNRVSQRLALFDFESCGIGVAAADFVWLAAGSWAEDPGLRRACLLGYGRDFTDAEVRALPALIALAAVEDLQWAARNSDPRGVAYAHRILARMEAECH